MLRPTFIIGLAIGALCAASIVLGSRPAEAGPVTGGAGNPPYTKAAVYGGVVSIIPSATAAGILELGNAGTDIAVTTDLYLRPGGSGQVVTQANSVKIYRNFITSAANVYVPGKVCLYGSGSEVCKDVWDAGGGPGGTSFWRTVSESLPPPFTSGTYLEPIQTYEQYGVRLGNTGTEINRNDIITLNQGLHAVNKHATGYAMDIVGNIESTSWTVVNGALTFNGKEAWYPSVLPYRNEGLNSGLDADKLDGVDVKLEPATAPGCTGVANRVACVCFYFQSGATKRCAALANQP